MQWFKKNPGFLRKESTALSNDSNYKELYQCRDNLFISHGNIIVRLNKVHRFPILIVYTDATPYRLPLIFPLQRELSEPGVNELSSLSLGEAIERIKPVIAFYYDLRHQNSSGELCTLEQDNLDSGSSFFGITAILQRVRDWCAGHITKQYPPDSEEVNFCAHFNFINQDMKLFYPEHFVNNDLVEGECFAGLFKFIPKGRFLKHDDKYVYMGSFLDGIGKSGLIEQVHINLERHLLHEKLNTSLDIYKHPEIVSKLVAEKKLLRATWFQISKEPQPFYSFKNLIEIIGNGDYDIGIKRIAARCEESFKQIPNSFLLGIRFPNRKGDKEFQLFKIYESSTPPEFIIHKNAEDRIRAILERFEKVEAIETEKLTESTFHQRNSTMADYTILKDASVNVFGVGAIGSEVADCMAKAGTGNLMLFDNQIVQAHNAVRHLVGMEHIGEPKVTAVAEILYNHNPFINYGLNPLNLYDLDTSQHIEDNSITVSSVADDNVEGYVNQQLVIANKPAFYIRALRGGKVARIFRVIPGKDACFHCLSLYRREKKHFIEVPDDPAFPTLKNECNNPIRPASAADLKFIASFAARLLIDHLQKGEADYNHWIWSSEILENTPINTPYQVYSQHLSPHPDCFYCNHDKQVKVSIPESAVSFMQKLISKNSEIETGGVMAGEINENGDITITDVSGPGPRAVQKATKFEKDVEYCQQFLDKLYIKSNQKVVYVGEWHSHPSLNNHPSGTDIKSLTEISVQKNYLTDCPVMIIYSNTGVPSCTLHPAGKRYYFTELSIEKKK